MTQDDNHGNGGNSGPGGGGNPGQGGGDGNPGHQANIIINGRTKPWSKEKISFEELVALSGVAPTPGEDPDFTITYRNGPKQNPEGTLTRGHSVKVQDGMVFNVAATNRS